MFSRQFIAAATLLSSVGIFLGSGCSSSETSGAHVADAASDVVTIEDSQPQPSVDAAICGTSSSFSGPACFDPTSSLAFVNPPLTPLAHQAKCASDAVVSAFYDACIGDGSGDSGDGCNAFIVANRDCALCLARYGPADAGDPPPSPWPAVLQFDQAGDLIPAVAVCVAAISSASDDCKQGYAAVDLCAESGCASCSENDFAQCQQMETQCAFSKCVNPNVDDACLAAIAAVPSADADSKCGASTTIMSPADFQNVFMKVGKTLCETN